MKKIITLALKTAALFFVAHFVLQGLDASVQSQEEKALLQHEVTVTIKLIQVYVTDKKGNPAIDLTREDFTLYDTGKKQAITEFEKHILELPSARTHLQPEIIQESKLSSAQEMMSRKFFLFFDFAYNNAKGIVKAREAALHFIDTQVQPLDEVGVLSYSTIKSFVLHEYLTTDHKKVKEVVEKLGMKDIAGRAESFETEYWEDMSRSDLRPMDVKAKSEGGRPPSDTIDKFMGRGESRTHALFFSRKMTDLAKALRYIPGHKHIVLFSSGIPYAYIYGVQGPRAEEWGSSLLRQKYEDMLKELSASNTVIYTLDTEEMGTISRKDTRTLGIFSLQKIASATGGKYFGNINNYEQHIEKIQNLTGCYYVVGYYIDEKWDGKYHEIKVEVKKPGYKIHAQKGYFNPKPFKEYNDLERMLHLFDLALSEKPLFQTPIRFPSAALSFSLDREAGFCLISKILTEELREVLRGKVEIISVIFDKKENIVELRRGEREPSEFPGENFYYYSFFSLPPGEYKCRFVLRNLETGKGAVASSSASIHEKQEKGIQLFTPLFLASKENTVYMKGVSRKSRREADSLSLVSCFHYDSSQYSPFVDDSFQANSVYLAVVSYSIFGISAPEVVLFASLTEKASSETISLDISSISEIKEDSRVIHFIRIQMPHLLPGEYALNLTAYERKSESVSQDTRDIKIR